ncbi:MAG: glycogen phosphorylase [Epulopiscium sp. Nele67-Bin005]|nr:MAG: glycogen phosphorylase [Epulopiscium sp. Nele67-Bin005]
MKFKKEVIKNNMQRYCKVKFGRNIEDANNYEVMNSLGLALLEEMVDDWNETNEVYNKQKRAYYISAEFLMGRALGNNLINLGVYDEVKSLLEEMNLDINAVEDAEDDAALGNGGLGRLAACFMESGASTNIPLQGYGIRYTNGLFKQIIEENGSQTETADRWLSDPFSIRKDYQTVEVKFNDYSVKAVPYDMPIIAYGARNINTLRLWKSEPVVDFNINKFNSQKYAEAVQEKDWAENISRVLYPNDSNDEGKLLRLRQQYFLVSASLQDMIRSHKAIHGDLNTFADWHTAQLNDTHPVLAIPEFVRLLVDVEGFTFDAALILTRKTFAYTNHTILQEALEKWDVRHIRTLVPRIMELIEKINAVFVHELRQKGYNDEAITNFSIIKDERVHMANLAISIGYAVNGVAALHTDILKATELRNWYELYPEKFQNKTNGITPRRWLKYANPELSEYITELLGSDAWAKDLSELKGLEKFIDDEIVLDKIMEIKRNNKVKLATYIENKEGVTINPDSIFDIQVKRLHEYKRQLLSALYIVDLYFRLKENPDLDIPKSTYIFGAKAFPGYARAKGIVRFIGQIAKTVNADTSIKGKLKVVFIEDYRVTYAEKLVPASDVSKQISTAGKEASGTGNMKFMLNGAPTLGTYDGANVEIVAESGEENNFIFGLRVEDIEKIQHSYNPREYYDNNPSLKRAIDSLVDGTFSDGGSGEFRMIYNSLVEGEDWQRKDEYYVLADFQALKDAEEDLFKAYQDKQGWAKKCLMNIANAGTFSSDRTILQYANEIWNITPSTLS